MARMILVARNHEYSKREVWKFNFFEKESLMVFSSYYEEIGPWKRIKRSSKKGSQPLLIVGTKIHVYEREKIIIPQDVIEEAITKFANSISSKTRPVSNWWIQVKYME